MKPKLNITSATRLSKKEKRLAKKKAETKGITLSKYIRELIVIDLYGGVDYWLEKDAG